MLGRPRRLRQNVLIRDLVCESTLSVSHLIQPYFLSEKPNVKDPISGFTGVFRWGIDELSKQLETDCERGLKSFLLFGSASHKDASGSDSRDPNGGLPSALRAIRSRLGSQVLLFTDVCLCPYTSEGHCGVVKDDKIINDESLTLLSQMAVVHAQAGADFVAPSDMMDGRILAIRKGLDEMGYHDTGILAYTAKYASNYYGPFREALDSAPKGDRASYQMDFRNSREALRELKLDEQEGADIVMVKPALAYLDIIHQFRANTVLPIAAYSVSAEYEMVKQLAKTGMAVEQKIVIENLTAIHRAGAGIIVTYHASEIAEKKWL